LAHAGWEAANSLGLQTFFDPSNVPTPSGFESGTTQSLSGWLGGAQIGYNHQFNNAVLGLEFSGSWDGVRNQNATTLLLQSTAANVPAACYRLFTALQTAPDQTNTLSCSVQQDWTAQVLFKLGYTFDRGRLLPYLTGGAAMTGLDFSSSLHKLNPGTPPGNFLATWASQNVLLGGVLGGGIQYAFRHSLSVGAEYLYALYPTQDFSTVATVTNSFGVTSPYSAPANHDLSTQTVRLVVNYNFGD
jgi:outer membrane immunogenic protein